MKIMISVDMEGICGIDFSSWLNLSHPNHTYVRELMTDEVNVAAKACHDKGIVDIFVVDGHASGNNLVRDRLYDYISIIEKNDEEGMLSGIDSSFDAIICLGYHGKANGTNSFCAHTNSLRTISSVYYNDIELSEGLMNALVAKYFDAKLIMISGTNDSIKEVSSFIDNIKHVEAKHSINWDEARSIQIDEFQDRLYNETLESLELIDSIKLINFNIDDVNFTVFVPYNFLIEKLEDYDVSDKSVCFSGDSIWDGYKKYRILLKLLSQRYREIFI